MIYFVCTECSLCLQVNAAERDFEALLSEDGELQREGLLCPTCRAPCDRTLVPPTGRARTHLTSKEAYAAFVGAGLPTERECSATAVKQLLTGATIKRVKVQYIKGSRHCALTFIVLGSGETVYFGASSFGCVVNRVQKEANENNT